MTPSTTSASCAPPGSTVQGLELRHHAGVSYVLGSPACSAATGSTPRRMRHFSLQEDPDQGGHRAPAPRSRRPSTMIDVDDGRSRLRLPRTPTSPAAPARAALQPEHRSATTVMRACVRRRSRCRWYRCCSTWSGRASPSTPSTWSSCQRAAGRADRWPSSRRRIEERAGEPFNLNSPAQIGEILFAQARGAQARAANVRPKKHQAPASGRPTPRCWRSPGDSTTRCPELHPRATASSTKLKSTYVDSLPKLTSTPSHRAHPHHASTRRWQRPDGCRPTSPTCRTSRSAPRRAARSAGRSSARADDWVLLSADYSQIELRILAHMSGDKGP